MAGKRERQREAVIDTARQIFCQQGIENATMTEIACKCSISRRTLYTYYTCKDALAGDIYIENLAALFGREARLFYGENRTDIATLEVVLRGYLDIRREHPEYIYYDYLYNNYCASRGYNPHTSAAFPGLIRQLYLGRSLAERRETLKTVGHAADSLYLFFCYLQKSVMLAVQRGGLHTNIQDKEDEAYLDFFLQSIRVLAPGH